MPAVVNTGKDDEEERMIKSGSYASDGSINASNSSCDQACDVCVKAASCAITIEVAHKVCPGVLTKLRSIKCCCGCTGAGCACCSLVALIILFLLGFVSITLPSLTEVNNKIVMCPLDCPTEPQGHTFTPWTAPDYWMESGTYFEELPAGCWIYMHAYMLINPGMTAIGLEHHVLAGSEQWGSFKSDLLVRGELWPVNESSWPLAFGVS